MNATIIYAHPNPASFNHAILERVTAELAALGVTSQIRDLYQLDFDPLLKPADFEAFKVGTVPADIRAEQEYIQQADWLVFIYPTWWWDRPAILKGYIDRVFSHGFAYGVGADLSVLPLLSDKRAFVFNTFGGSDELQRTAGNVDNLVAKSMTVGTLALCGIETIYHPISGLFSSAPASRAILLDEIGQLIIGTLSRPVHSV